MKLIRIRWRGWSLYSGLQAAGVYWDWYNHTRLLHSYNRRLMMSTVWRHHASSVHLCVEHELCWGWRHVASFDALPFCSSVLEPDFDLNLGELKLCGDTGAFSERQIFLGLHIDNFKHCEATLGQTCRCCNPVEGHWKRRSTTRKGTQIGNANDSWWARTTKKTQKSQNWSCKN